MMLQGMAAAAAGHPGSLHHALQSPPNSNAAAINPAGGFLFLPQNPNTGMQGQQMHPGNNAKTNHTFLILLRQVFYSLIIAPKKYYIFRKRLIAKLYSWSSKSAAASSFSYTSKSIDKWRTRYPQ